MAKSKKTKDRDDIAGLMLYLDRELVEELRNAVAFMRNKTESGALNMTTFAQQCLRDGLDKLRAKENHGRAFPKRPKGKLSGRPKGYSQKLGEYVEPQ